MIRVFIFVCAVFASGCSTLAYYGHSLNGQLSVLSRARPIDSVIADPATDTKLRERLIIVRGARDFASRELGLPDNDSYRRYADLERPYALWNVFAAPELSLEPKRWCYPIAGCTSYHSYFAQEPAEQEAAELTIEGYDVHVGGVAAYSTSGWFDDPVLNTMLESSSPEIAGVLFHELGHQQLFLPDHTSFNESFATTVEREGVRRWLAANGAQADYAVYLERAQRREAFTTLLMRYRAQLLELYHRDQDDIGKRAGKQALFRSLQQDYTELKKYWKGYAGYDRWMEKMNNAKFLSVGLYHTYVPAFEVLLAQQSGDLKKFYAAAAAIAQLPAEEREQQLRALGHR